MRASRRRAPSVPTATRLRGLHGPCRNVEVIHFDRDEDELGAAKPSEWVWDTVSLILNTRYNNNRTTIITTNFDNEPAGTVSGARGAAREETLGDRIGERMRSRLHEMCRIVRMEGQDFRQKFRSANFR